MSCLLIEIETTMKGKIVFVRRGEKGLGRKGGGGDEETLTGDKEHLYNIRSPFATTTTKVAAATTTTETTTTRQGRNRRSNFYYDDIILMGQFNYNTIHLEYVVHWYKRWNEVFKHVHIRGPFTLVQIQKLNTKYNITTVYQSDDDAGFYSPVVNLVETMKQSQNNPSSNIKGVLSIHDDLLLNLTDIDSILSSNNNDGRNTNRDATTSTTGKKHKGNTIFTQIYESNIEEPVAVFHTKNKQYRTKEDPKWVSPYHISSTNSGNLPEWPHWGLCMKPLAIATSNDPNGTKFTVSPTKYKKTKNWTTPSRGNITHVANNSTEDDEQWVPMFDNAYTDVIYIPMSLAQPTIDIGTWLYTNKVFLECAIPMLVEYVAHRYQEEQEQPQQQQQQQQYKTGTNTNITTTNKKTNIHTLSSCIGEYDIDRKDYVRWTNQCFGGDLVPVDSDTKSKMLRPSTGPYDVFHPIKLSAYSILSAQFDFQEIFFLLIFPSGIL